MRGLICLSLFLVVGLVFAQDASAQDLAGIADQAIPTFISILASVMQAIAWGIGKLIILIIGMIIIPILQYNNFGSSNVVSIGWALVRDVVNMFVIIVLLVIAIQTMIGVDRVDWRQQLPRFFIAVIAVNFSKTITLFIIDIGQVVMFTFVNALSDIAAGNFINLFQVSSFFELSTAPGFGESLVETGGVTAVGFLATSYLTVTLLGMVLAVLLLLAFVYIYRIILLWVLLVMSPLAFFAGGVGDILPAFKQTSSQWWSRLIGAVTLGPILTFFLWLALASASAGPITESEGFNTAPSADASATGLYTEAFDTDKLLSIFLAIVLISVGFQAASSQASAIGGPAAKFITAGGGQALLRKGLSYPGRAGFATARAGGRGLAAGGRQLERYDSRFAPSKVTSSAARLAGDKFGTGLVGRQIAKPFYAAEQRAGGVRAEVLKQAQQQVDSFSGQQKLTEYDAILAGGGAGIGQEGVRAQMVKSLATDKDEQKAFRSHLESQEKKRLTAQFPALGESEINAQAKEKADTDMQKVMKDVLKKTDARKDDLIGEDKGLKSKLYQSKSANLHLLDDDAVAEHINDEDFKVSGLTEDSITDKRVQDALRQKNVGQYTDKDTGEQINITAWDHVKQGRGGVDRKVREFATGQDQGSLGQFGTKRSGKEVLEGLKKGTLNPSSLQASEVQGKQEPIIVDGLRGAAIEGIDLSTINEKARQEVTRAIGDPSTISDATEQNASRKLLFSMNGSPESLGVNNDGSIESGSRGLVADAIKQDLKSISKVLNTEAANTSSVGDPKVRPRDIATDLTNEIAQSVSVRQVQDMAKASATATEQDREAIKKTLTGLIDVISAERGRDAKHIDKIDDKKLKGIENAVKSASRLMR